MLRYAEGFVDEKPKTIKGATSKNEVQKYLKEWVRDTDQMTAGIPQAIAGGEAEEALTVLTGWPCQTILFDEEVLLGLGLLGLKP